MNSDYPPVPMILLFGGGGHCKAVIDLVRAIGRYQIAGILDDHLEKGSQVLGITVLGGSELAGSIRQDGVRLAVNTVGGIGDYRVRLKGFENLEKAGYSFPALVHPAAFVEPSSTYDDGVQILPAGYLGSAARVGFGTILNAGVVVSHDCVIGRVANLSPGAILAGGVVIGDYAQVGMGVTVNLNLSIGSGARIGNGATVKADVPADGRVFAGATWPEKRHAKE